MRQTFKVYCLKTWCEAFTALHQGVQILVYPAAQPDPTEMLQQGPHLFLYIFVTGTYDSLSE